VQRLIDSSENPVLGHEKAVAFAATMDGQRSAQFYEQTLGLRIQSDDSFAVCGVARAAAALLFDSPAGELWR
jgi:hypothetical protein